MKRPALWLGIMLVLLLTAGAAFAMSSTNYVLNWFVPLTGAGGPQMSSTHFTADVTAGQSAIAASASANCTAEMGFWRAFAGSRVFMPLVWKN